MSDSRNRDHQRRFLDSADHASLIEADAELASYVFKGHARLRIRQSGFRFCCIKGILESGERAIRQLDAHDHSHFAAVAADTDRCTLCGIQGLSPTLTRFGCGDYRHG